uniref:Uncharacterized protein n=1 Tax=Anguilla anguilla TaxID=7936 RepID=A0A0E9QK98_ANGAN
MRICIGIKLTGFSVDRKKVQLTSWSLQLTSV